MALLAKPRRPEPLPARIDRRRIYILPTGYGLFFGAVLVAMLMGGLNYNNNPALLLTFVLAAAVHNSFVRAHLNLSGLSLEAVHAEPVHAGQTMRLRCVLAASGSRVRPGLVLEGQPIEPLASGRRVEVVVPLATHRRGRLPLPRIRLWTLHPMGFARAWCWLWPQDPALVYPALESNAPPLPTDGGEGRRTRQDPSGADVHHLRDYRIGDPLRQIAWKSSARSDRLLVREFETGSGTEVHLSFQALHSLPPEARISRLARWVIEADRVGARYTLALPDQVLGPDAGPAHRHACLKALALMPHG